MLKVEAKAKLRELSDLLLLQRNTPGSGIQINRQPTYHLRVMLVDAGRIIACVRIDKEYLSQLCYTAGCTSVSAEALIAQVNGNLDDEARALRASARQNSGYGDW